MLLYTDSNIVLIISKLILHFGKIRLCFRLYHHQQVIQRSVVSLQPHIMPLSQKQNIMLNDQGKKWQKDVEATGRLHAKYHLVLAFDIRGLRQTSRLHVSNIFAHLDDVC